MPTPDAILARRAQLGDQAALGQLAARHRRAVYGLARHMTGDPEAALDLAQDAMIRAYVRMGELRDPDRFRPWVLSITRSVCANWLNAQTIRRALADGMPPAFPPPAPSAAEEVEAGQQTSEVRGLVGGLDEPYRTSVARYYLDGDRQAAIARDLGAPVGTVKSWLHQARRTLRERMTNMTQDWYGECEWPSERESTMTLEDLARRALKCYDLGVFEAIGSIHEPHESIGVGVRTDRGRYRLWRYHGFMTPELVEVQHAMLRHLDGRGVPVKRLVPARDSSTWQEINGHLVALFEWFSGPMPDIRNRRDLAQVAQLQARWTQAMDDFDPPIDGWRDLATRWRPRKDWAWVLPMAQLPLVPKRMGFLAAVRDLENPPSYHDAILEEVRDTEARLTRFADMAEECGLAELPRGVIHGVFLFGCMDWELMVTDADDFRYEARIADLARLLFALHDWAMPDYQLDDRVALAVDTYRECVEVSDQEVRALPVIAWGQRLWYDTFHILLYLCEQSSPDRGEYLVAQRPRGWVGERDRVEARLLGLGEALA